MIKNSNLKPIQDSLNFKQPDVAERMGIRVTDWGEVLRLDMSQLGAVIPEMLLLSENTGLDKDELKNMWAEMQVDGMLEAMENSAIRFGGDFCSFAEWTVVYGAFYSSTMRAKRKAKFGDNYRAAISSLKWLNPESGLSGYIQASAYIPKNKDIRFKQENWRPKCMADYEMFVVAPAVTACFGGVNLLHVAGMLGFDTDGNLMYSDSPEKQIQFILENIISVFEEAGGSRTDVVRLRPFAQTPEIASIIRRKVKELWHDGIEPTILMSDGMRFGGPDDKHFAEIQAFGIIPGASDIKHQMLDDFTDGLDQDTFTVRSTVTRDFEFIQASEIRAERNSGSGMEASRVIRQVEELLQKTGLRSEDLCSVIVYAGTLEAAYQMEKAIQNSSISRDAVHLIPCPAIREMDGRQIKAEVSARKLFK